MREADTGRALEGVLVQLVGTRQTQTTNESGRFLFRTLQQQLLEHETVLFEEANANQKRQNARASSCMRGHSDARPES